MNGTLDALAVSLKSLQGNCATDFRHDLRAWQKLMKPVEYSCFGCPRCIPAVASNIFNLAYPDAALNDSPCCSFEVREGIWPPVPGEYFVIKGRKHAPVAVTTLASAELAEKLAALKPEGLRIAGKTETENIGMDKLVKNVVSNTALRFLILAGKETRGHKPGRTLIYLSQRGVDKDMRVKRSPAPRPFLRNVSRDEIERFRRQVQLVDMIGCEDANRIALEVEKLNASAACSCGCDSCHDALPAHEHKAPVIKATSRFKVKLDKAGYFVVLPLPEPGIISVEHYSYDNKLMHVIEGRNAREICLTLVGNGWIGELTHAAYMGRELARAELSIRKGTRYMQEGA
jgi:tetrahydromethanopterin S-methyltransferase subunit A